MGAGVAAGAGCWFPDPLLNQPFTVLYALDSKDQIAAPPALNACCNFA